MKKNLSALLCLSFLAFIIYGCQDDPILQPVVDGVPVITPKSKAYITVIQLNDFPSTDPNGDTWDTINLAQFDTLGSPDIFFNITTTDPDPAVLWSQNSHFSDARESDTIPFYLLNPFEIVPFGSNINVNLYDFELPDSTLMGSISFFIGEYPDPLNPYPTYITSEQNGYNVTIGVLWED